MGVEASVFLCFSSRGGLRVFLLVSQGCCGWAIEVPQSLRAFGVQDLFGGGFPLS